MASKVSKNAEKFSDLVKTHRQRSLYEVTLKEVERFSEIANLSRHDKRQLYQQSQQLVKQVDGLQNSDSSNTALATLETSLNYNPFNQEALSLIKTLKLRRKKRKVPEDRLRLYSLFRQIIYVERNWRVLLRWQNIRIKPNKELKTPVWLTMGLTLLFPLAGYAYSRRWPAFWSLLILTAIAGYLLTQESSPETFRKDLSLALGGGYFVMLVDQTIAATLNQRQLSQK